MEKILFNDSAVNRVNYSRGHDDHLHFSFKAPSGSLPAECRSTGSGYGWEFSEELEQEWEECLDDFWGSFTKPRIEDRTAFTPKDKRKGVRDIKKVSGQSEMESETKITMDSYTRQHLMDRSKRFPNPSHLNSPFAQILSGFKDCGRVSVAEEVRHDRDPDYSQ